MSRSGITLCLILLLSSTCVLAAVDGIKLSRKQISPFLTLTFVHGGDDARMTHDEARQFCLNLTKLATISNTTKTAMTPGDSAAESRPQRVQSDLISIHEPSMVHEVMGWVLPLEKRQFWIGGKLGKVVRSFQNRELHLIQTWTDGTPANYRFLHFSPADLEQMSTDQVLCISVDYASGKWGAHDCATKMFFVCETIRLPDSVLLAPEKNENATPVTASSSKSGSSTAKPINAGRV